jgi:N-acetylneuraminate synthase
MIRPDHGRTLVIAEAGVNHNGDQALALQLVDRAAEAGADMVKFQTFDAAAMTAPSARKADYQTRTTDRAESQLDMLRRLQLSVEDHRALIGHCQSRGIIFLSSVFDVGSLRLLTGTFGLKQVKLGSGELTNAPLLWEIARADVDVILSTGMATLSEVETALGVLALGYVDPDARPGREAFAAALKSPSVWTLLQKRVTLLHCTTEYPAAAEDTNLAAMDTLRAAFGLVTGYSDHTEGSAITIAAVARGAAVIEKHFTLDRTLPGPDHAASLEPGELAALVRDIRRTEAALGSGIKQPCAAEERNRPIARKSLFAARDLPAGHVLTEQDIAVMRPVAGLEPMSYWDLCGRRLDAAVAAGEPFA